MVRYILFFIMLVSMVLLAYCAHNALKSDKPIAKSVHDLLLSAVPMIMGIALTTVAKNRIPAEIGYYLYYIGMNVLMSYYLAFSLDYCRSKRRHAKFFYIVYVIVFANIVQILLNPFFGNVFVTRVTFVGGTNYYARIPHIGHYIHLAVIYLFAATVMIIFVHKILTSSHIYIERYVLILLSMMIAAIWESVYYIANMPLDTSFISFTVCGLLVYYFSLHYTPVFLLSAMLRSIASDLPEYLYFFDENGECIWANAKGMDFLGLESDDLQKVRKIIEVRFPQMCHQNEDWCGIQTEGKGSDARYYQLESHINTDAKYNDRITGRFLSIRDNTEEQRRLQQEQYAARHDRLTGLYNREHLFKCVEKELRENPDVRYQVSYVDVNEFKLINDVFGRDFGDYTIKKIAEWISKDMPEHTYYGRIGGDTFGVCQPLDMLDPERLNDFMSNFVVKMGNKEHHVLIQVGIYVVDEADTDVSIMFDRARMALRSIKRTYSHLAYYDDEIRESILREQILSAELEDAIAERQVRPYLQPIVDTEGKVKGAEALVRWIHPKMGFLSPAEFIPLFEKNGRIADLDRYMWRCAGEILSEWKVTHPDYFLSVNISTRDFYFMDIESEIRAITDEFDIDPSKMRLEITESVMMTNMEERLRVINGLRDSGHVIEVDDFGSGYSSFNMLKDIPADLIKLDQMFLRNAEDNEKARVILERVIKMIEKLGMVSLTEGVETDRQFKGLTDMGCRLFQGYHFSKPLPQDDFESFCQKNKAG